MRTFALILFSFLLFPIFANAQEISNGPDNCAIAGNFINRFAEVKKDAAFNITSNSDCRLMIDPGKGLEVVSFQLSMNMNKSFITETSNNNMFTMTMQTDLKAVAKGEKVYVENIVVKGADGKEFKLKPVTVVM